MKRIVTALALCLATLCLSVAALAQDDIRLGVLSDLTGPTGDVGVPYAEGIKDAAAYLNSQGGVAGKKIALTQVDYAYNAQQALSAYKKFIAQDKIVALLGWGTQDTEALTKFVGKDQVPTISASYSAHLTDPASAPYNFFIAADYSTQMRAALKFFKDRWKQARAPKVAFVYPDASYGLAPIPAGKAFAKELGYEIVGEENVGLKAMDATAELLRLQKLEPDYTWIGGTTQSTAVIMKDAQKLGMKTVFFTNIWGSDENLVKLAGDAAEGSYSLQAAVIYGQDVPGMKIIEKQTGGKPQMTHYIRGFASMLVMAEGIKRAAAAGEITGPAIKTALETLRDYDPMGLTPAISFFPDDHRPNMAVFLYKIEGGKLTPAGTETLERKAEWLGK
ncbi:ABC transporter substrate-binding protein [Desulfolutivibrio sulfoxidireducens]|uniref:ABC transporter substrate-binding protein n=1 Tax=Desulfolutivibrio sulfoxidireducens TaxID=2773299 RepID=UPI00159D71AB|nr:ABC transporter substrate-binding protein [Desulfolutivibrio sulfoxidireducens]QLA16637.1 ABC transporter substrate-binding protein [Desulfolutivibrio sulfoxidireducens]QLA19483.1 ABC transporter substrate-binding protein [Desulfolutivibrio sulfoxidireducens]